MINDEQASMLRTMVGMGGWQKVVMPVLAERGRSLIKALCVPEGARHEAYKGQDDNLIRGRIQEVEWMLTWVDNEIKVYDHNRRLEELSREGAKDGAGSSA